MASLRFRLFGARTTWLWRSRTLQSRSLVRSKTRASRSWYLRVRSHPGPELSPSSQRHWDELMAPAQVYSPGSLVSARGREWIVLTGSDAETLLVRPISGSEADHTLIHLALEAEP